MKAVKFIFSIAAKRLLREKTKLPRKLKKKCKKNLERTWNKYFSRING